MDTQDIAPDDAHALFESRGQLGWFVFAPHALKEEDVPDEPEGEFRTDKSPGQRLRAVLYALWGQMGLETRGDFDAFYRRSMEKFIELVKQKLNP